MTLAHAAIAAIGIVGREFRRFLQQRERFIAALVRPLLWLVIFAAGFRAALGVSITPPYQTYVTYDVYIAPGLAGMVLLFAGMQTSLAMVYDREMGSMRLMLVSPLPRWFLLMAKLTAGALVAVAQAYVFLIIAGLGGVDLPPGGLLSAAPALLLAALMLGALGLLLASLVRGLENFAGVMNFVIFPLFFLSSALYPLWKMREASDVIAAICALNPFTYAVELIRFALYGRLEPIALAVVVAATLAFAAAAIFAFTPARGFRPRMNGGD